MLDRLVIWLERHGIDCSAEANRDDAFVFAVVVGLMFALGAISFSEWWSGFIAAVVILKGHEWLERRYPKAR